MYIQPLVGVDEWGPAIIYPSLSDELKKWSDHENDIVGVREIALDEMPVDRDSREAWTDSGKLTIDMDRARAIHQDRLRSCVVPSSPRSMSRCREPTRTQPGKRPSRRGDNACAT